MTEDEHGTPQAGTPVPARRNPTYREALQHAALWFRNYQHEHEAKGDAGVAKADTNARRAAYLENVLKGDPQDEHGTPQASPSVPGLPVAGYKPTQPPKAIEAVNVFKELEERTLRHIETLMASGEYDNHWLAIGRTQLQQGFMSANRGVFQPGRVTLAEDKT